MSTTAIWDYKSTAEIDSDNNIVIVENEDAVVEALKNWAQTNRGEIINDPNAGGGLNEYIFKQFSESKNIELLFRFRAQLDTNFSPRLKIMDLYSEFDSTLNALKIKLKYFIPIFNVEKLTYFPLKRLDYKSIFAEQNEEINYTGDTLLNFIKIYLWDQRGIGLKYNGAYWQWGKFIFTELDESDDNFEIIDNLINSNRDT